MEFNIKSINPETQRSACIIVAVFAEKKLSAAAKRLDTASGGYIRKILKQGDLTGAIGQTLLLHNVSNLLSSRILLVGCGKEQEFGDKQYKDTIKSIIKALKNTHATDTICFMPECTVKDRDIYWKIQQAIIVTEETLYNFDVYKSNTESNTTTLRRFTFNVANKNELPKAKQAMIESITIAKGIKYTKDLTNTPPNICTPTYLAAAATKLAKDFKKIKTTILQQKDMENLGMGALLAVAAGSSQPPKLITLEYRGDDPKQAPIVLVGKGITFDSGGLSLKPPTSQIGMKYDMSGAAAVLGTILIAAELDLPLNIVGVIAAAENMPGGTACRPNDIVKSLSGITIEILNTDAEGRLILCDALSYSERFKPKVVIDIATLTGACIIALGKSYSGLFSNHAPLANELFAAGNLIADKCWQLPLAEEYQELLNSKFADIKNIGNGDAGSITAACFLSRFTKQYHWAHLDIAGTACDNKASADASSTGRPVPLLAQYLLNCCHHP